MLIERVILVALAGFATLVVVLLTVGAYIAMPQFEVFYQDSSFELGRSTSLLLGLYKISFVAPAICIGAMIWMARTLSGGKRKLHYVMAGICLLIMLCAVMVLEFAVDAIYEPVSRRGMEE